MKKTDLYTTRSGPSKTGHSVWHYSAARGWVLRKRACMPGYEPAPPQEPGGYEGELKRTACVPRPQSGQAAGSP
jgi:hypothetical protein